jgi:signal transduction histidine kinase/DNA-binding NarL/FixJ family response regulator
MPPLHLLVVEDIPADAEKLLQTVGDAGFRVTCDRTEAIDQFQQLLQTNRYDAVLTEYQLANFTAYQVLEVWQQLGQTIPFILVTGSLGEEAAVDCIKAGMTDYVLKDHLFRLPMALERSLREFDLKRQQAAAIAQIQQQAQREKLLNQLSRTINSSFDSDYILQEIVRLTGECFAVDRVVILEVEAGEICVAHEWLASEAVPSMLEFTAPVEDLTGLVDPATGNFNREPFQARDYASLPTTPSRQKLLHQKQMRSLLSVAIVIHDRFYGCMELHTTHSYRAFQQGEVNLLQRLADQAAIALDNAHSYERLEEIVRARTHELEQEKLLSDAANRAKSEFISNMSHELRTPLTGILGFSSVLLKEVFGSLNEKQRQYLESISACGEHLLSLINDLLDLSKIEAGREDLILEQVDIPNLAETALSPVREQAERQGLQLSLEIAAGIETCTADRRRLKQILFNLLSNAVKFTDRGAVKLAIEQDGGSYLFHVFDTGIGIAPEELKLLFQPFQQLDGGLDRQYQGTGLGLSLARKLAHLHGGDITVTSKLGCGSCFTLHLPVQPSPTRQAAPPPSTSASSSSP